MTLKSTYLQNFWGTTMITSYFVKDIKIQEIWSLEEIKNYLRISYEYDDQLIQGLIGSAVDTVEKFTGLGLYQRIINCKIQNSKNSFALKYLPIINIEQVSLVQKEHKKEIIDVFGKWIGNKIYLNQEYVGEDIEIEYVAGHGAEIPSVIKQGIIMHVAAMYEHSENGTNLNSQIRDLYLPYRIMKI